MTKKDPFGHTIEVGTTVRFFSKHYKYTSIKGNVIKITPQTLLLEHEHMNISGYTTTTRCTSAQVFVDTTGWAPKTTP